MKLIVALWLVAIGVLGCGSGSPSSDAAGGSAGGGVAGSGGFAGNARIPDSGVDAAGGSAGEPSCAPFNAAIQTALDNAVSEQSIPGALAEVKTADCTWRGASGFSELATKQVMDPDSLFRIGSITKTFVAAVVLALAKETKLSLEDPLSKYVPGYPNADAITLRQLLGHRSGIFNYTQSQAFLDAWVADPKRIWAPEELVAFAASEPPYFPPGQGFSYSNTDYILAGMVIEKVTAAKLAGEIRSRILDPIGLTRTYFADYEASLSGLAHGYHQGDDATDEFHQSWGWAAGALVSSTADTTRFYEALLGGELLAPSELAEMKALGPVDALFKANGYTGYGLGLLEYSTPLGPGLGHTGGQPGYQAFAFQIPSRSALVSVFVSSSSHDGTAVFQTVAKAIGDAN